MVTTLKRNASFSWWEESRRIEAIPSRKQTEMIPKISTTLNEETLTPAQKESLHPAIVTLYQIGGSKPNILAIRTKSKKQGTSILSVQPGPPPEIDYAYRVANNDRQAIYWFPPPSCQALRIVESNQHEKRWYDFAWFYTPTTPKRRKRMYRKGDLTTTNRLGQRTPSGQGCRGSRQSVESRYYGNLNQRVA